jgi:hypothetical protein
MTFVKEDLHYVLEMETACPICLEEFNDNKYEINCRPGKRESKHVICNSCESSMRQATRPTLRVKKGETHRQIKCPLCRGVETVENPRSAASYKAELESLYLLMVQPVPAPAPVRPLPVSRPLSVIRQEAEDMRNRRIARQQMREAIANSLRENARDPAVAARMLAMDPVATAARIRTAIRGPVAAPGAARARVVPVPAVPIADTGSQKMWCVFRRNGVACTTLSKTKRKCCAPLENGNFCQEKVCRSCNKCDWH